MMNKMKKMIKVIVCILFSIILECVSDFNVDNVSAKDVDYSSMSSEDGVISVNVNTDYKYSDVVSDEVGSVSWYIFNIEQVM